MEVGNMTNKELYTLTQKAVREGEMFDYLQGNGDYKCPPNKYLPAYIPTDFERILKQGICAYYIATKDKKIVKDLEKAIKDLCNGDTVQVWIAYTYLGFMTMMKYKKELPFEFEQEEIRKTVEKAVVSKKEELKKCKEWNGWNNEEGLWQEIERTNGVLKANYHYMIINSNFAHRF